MPDHCKKLSIMVVTDSNGKKLDLELLKPCAINKIQRDYKFTVTEATDGIPTTTNPDEVTDLVFQVGLNDSRHGISAEKICENTLEMQLKYRKSFKNARQHIVALPPLDNRQIDTNYRLQKLSKYTGSNFVSTKAFRDRMTGNLQKNLMEKVGRSGETDYHYNDIGIKTLSKEIKKSLFSESNLKGGDLDHLQTMRETTNAHNGTSGDVTENN